VSSPHALGEWRLIEAPGGHGGRYRHLLLVHSSYEPGAEQQPQISLPEADEWGAADGPFFFRAADGGGTLQIGADGSVAADQYDDMPASGGRHAVALATDTDAPPLLAPARCAPMKHPWCTMGGAWPVNLTVSFVLS
jgi:hypothetical protein